MAFLDFFKSKQKPVRSYNLEIEIPRYPPFAEGLPYATGIELLATQKELINKIKQTIGLNDKEFATVVEPVLLRYAEYVHLLPASENHHHRGAGGLLHHGLEVAYYSAKAALGVLFTQEGTPRQRRNGEPRWRVAACFGGLFHDIGKPITDVTVTDRNGTKIWNPHTDTLCEWLQKNEIDRYFLHWSNGRHKRHERFAMQAIDKLLPKKTKEYLFVDGRKEIYEEMCDAILDVAVNPRGVIGKIVGTADSASTQKDLKQNRISTESSGLGVPVERYIIDAMQRLVKSKWKSFNTLESPVWILDSGVFIQWQKAVTDINELLAKDAIAGVPKVPNALADILIERGFALHRVETKDGAVREHRYWQLEIDLAQADVKSVFSGIKQLETLRLETMEILYIEEPPICGFAKVLGEVTVSLNIDEETDTVTMTMSQQETACNGQSVQIEPESSALPFVVIEDIDSTFNSGHSAGEAKPDTANQGTSTQADGAFVLNQEVSSPGEALDTLLSGSEMDGPFSLSGPIETQLPTVQTATSQVAQDSVATTTKALKEEESDELTSGAAGSVSFNFDELLPTATTANKKDGKNVGKKVNDHSAQTNFEALLPKNIGSEKGQTDTAKAKSENPAGISIDFSSFLPEQSLNIDLLSGVTETTEATDNQLVGEAHKASKSQADSSTKRNTKALKWPRYKEVSSNLEALFEVIEKGNIQLGDGVQFINGQLAVSADSVSQLLQVDAKRLYELAVCIPNQHGLPEHEVEGSKFVFLNEEITRYAKSKLMIDESLSFDDNTDYEIESGPIQAGRKLNDQLNKEQEAFPEIDKFPERKPGDVIADLKQQLLAGSGPYINHPIEAVPNGLRTHIKTIDALCLQHPHITRMQFITQIAFSDDWQVDLDSLLLKVKS